MTEIQEALLEMLNWFHNFCQENEIRYYVVAGTMLGAIRHKGFIPWDDDIDVVIPRPDYEKFMAMESDVDEDYAIETPYSLNPDYYFTYSKIYKKRTTLIEKSKHPCKRGLYIDVFPLDGIGITLKDSIKQFKRIDRYRILYNARCRSIEKGRNPLKNLAILMASVIPSSLIDERKLQREIDQKCKERAFEESQYVANFHTPYRYKEIFHKEIYGTPTLYRFENIDIFGVEKSDDYLRQLYGEYMKLPPSDKRVSRHDYIKIDLHHGYMNESATFIRNDSRHG